MIKKDKKVKIDYVLIVDGKITDTSKKSGPFEYIHGCGNIIKGLEKQIEGLRVGDKRAITVLAAEAYGPVNPKAFEKISKATLVAKNINPQIGQPLKGRDKKGNEFPVTISDIQDETVIVNCNHPFAGKDLRFDITVLDIQDGKKD